MQPNAFSHILKEMVQSIPGALGAIFIDWEGESVGEFSYQGEAADIRILGAQWGVIYYLFQTRLEKLRQEELTMMMLRLAQQTIVVTRTTEIYLLVLSMSSEGSLAQAMEVCRRTSLRLRREM